MAPFVNPLRSKLRAGQQTYGVWVTLESATVTELAADVGLDWICIDMEHGSLSWRDALDHMRAAKGSDLSMIVRVPAISVDTIKRALDLGAHGVLLPLVNRAEELQSAFSHARYPLAGKRGLGGERAVRWGAAVQDYVATANAETMVIPVIETAEAVANAAAILAVEGLEAIFFGPSDMSQSYGHMAVWEGPGIAAEIARIQGLATRAGIVSGVIGTGEADIARRVSEGFQMIGLGSDASLLSRKLGELLGPYRALAARKAGY